MNKCYLRINEVLWCSPQCSITGKTQEIVQRQVQSGFQIYSLWASSVCKTTSAHQLLLMSVAYWLLSRQFYLHKNVLNTSQNAVIKSPRYTGLTLCFCTSLYASAGFAAAAARRFLFTWYSWTNFQISFIFGRIGRPELQITWLDFGRF